MTDIIIYTLPETLLHKQDKVDDEDKSNCGMYYWQFSKMPKKIETAERVYFATEGMIRGYFLINDVTPSGEPYAEVPENTISWTSETWKDIEPIPTKSFQGFKYADKVEELKNV